MPNVSRGIVVSLLSLLSLAVGTAPAAIVYPSPAEQPRSGDFTVEVDGADSFTFEAKVAVRDAEMRAKVVDDWAHFGTQHETAAFTAFDLGDGPSEVVVTYKDPIREIHVLPASAKVDATIVGERQAKFRVDRPMNLTVEVNGDTVRSLHVFANAPERDVPKADDPKVIYFAPGVHDVDKSIDVGDGQTLYLAGGAILRAVSDGGGQPVVRLHGEGASIRGHGIIDGSRCSIHARQLIEANDLQDATVSGIILRDPPGWTMPLRRSDRVTIDNVKILGFRANSDGIDLCNSRDVVVRDCFIRTSDDLVVIKTDAGQGKAGNIDVHGCVLWNAFAHALSIGAELREDVDHVRFSDCDVIHDVGREWTLRVFHCDNAHISNVRFENIRVADSPRLASLWIASFVWSRAPERGHISGVTFDHISCDAGEARVDLAGFDAAHAIDHVWFKDVTIAGKPLRDEQVKRNAFVSDVHVAP